MKKLPIIIFLIFLLVTSAFAENDEFNIRFAVLGDSHIDADAEDDPQYFKLLNQSEDILRTAIDDVNSLNGDNDPDNDLDFVLFLGDNANSRWIEDYKLLSDILKDLTIPFYMIPGDWDFSPNYSPRMVNEYYGVPHDNLSENPIFEDSAVPGVRKYDWSVDYRTGDGDIVHLIGMDNVLHFDGNRGSFEQLQLDWLENDLDANKGKTTIIMLHCPVLSPYSTSKDTAVSDVDWIPFTKEMRKSGELEKNEFLQDIPWKKDRAADNSEEFIALVDKYNVPLVLAGDFHLNKKVAYPADNPETLYAMNPALVSFPCAYTIYEMGDSRISWNVLQIEKYAEVSREYNLASLMKYNRVYEKLGQFALMFNIEKTFEMSWGSDEGENNDWSGWFEY